MNQFLSRQLWAGSESWSISEALGADHASDLAMLAQSELFEPAWYLREYPDVAADGMDPATHFVIHGWQEGRRPNRYFDTPWYVERNPDVARTAINPVLHYIAAGEAEGRAPAEHFDLAWYATQHRRDDGRTWLAHFLARRLTGQASPLAEFDAAFYLTRYPDIALAGVDPFEHFFLYGFREGRDPSPGFDTRFYIHRYLGGVAEENPLLHYRRYRHALRLHTSPPPGETDAFAEVRRFSRPGPDFETIQPLPPSAVRRALVLAFYLPQFHPIPENDAWWGTGFTEWTAIARGMPRFAGHYQPRAPRDLGHYRLGDTKEGRATMRRQAEVARGGGIGGFVHYFYWFNRRRLLEAPLDAWLADHSNDFPFCLMWANENWTRRWDGSDHEVLIRQDYDEADDEALVACLLRHFSDPRYIRLDGRPLLMVYRAGEIPEGALARWRALFAGHGENPIWVMSQSFDANDPRQYGFDAAIEFPPHKLTVSLPRRNAEIALFDPHASANVYDYDDLVRESLGLPAAPFPLIRTAVPSWDNDARRQGAGLVLRNASPAAYQAWLTTLVERAAASPFLGAAPIVAVNAWNEWAEGAYLEPDIHYGAAYLNATARAVTRGGAATEPGNLLLVGHDAFPAGAQYLLLHLLRQLRRAHGVQAEYFVLGDGALADDYRAAGIGVVLLEAEREKTDALIAGWAGRGFSHAIVNTSAAAWIVPRLRAAGMDITLLIHELPGLIAEKNLLADARAGAAAANRVIFPAEFVRDRFVETTGARLADTRILPQGLYRNAAFDPHARTALRRSLGLATGTTLVLGAGYADLRKGFDLFLQAWRAARRRRANVVFAWIGAIDPAMRAYLDAEIAAAVATKTFLIPGHQRDVAAWLSAADVFALASREDPFPSVVLEALATGLPVVAFQGGGGIPELLAGDRSGVCVPMGDADAMARAVARHPPAPSGRAGRGAAAAASFSFAAYATTLLHAAKPDLPSISAVVPNYNYAGYLERRLASILQQTHPVAELVLLDDASTDDSLAVANRVAAEWQREITIVRNAENTGSVFRQWARAASLARGDLVWIAEADDEADPCLLAALAARLAAQPDTILAFCDSRAIDAEGREIWPSYRGYYEGAGADALARDGLFQARDFARRFLAERNLILNASAVLWRRTALLAALERCALDLPGFRIAGDWRVYLEALAEADGTVAYLATPLNAHRRHAASVTSATTTQTHFDEIACMHRIAATRLGLDAAAKRRQAACRGAGRSKRGGRVAPPPRPPPGTEPPDRVPGPQPP